MARRKFGGETFLHQTDRLTVFGTALIVVPIIAFLGNAPAAVLTWTPLGVLALGMAAVNRWGSQREFRRHALASRAIAGTLHDEGISLNTDVSESRLKWSAFTDFACLRDLILLTDSISVIALPRPFFATDTEFAAASEVVAKAVVRTPKPFLNWRRTFSLMTWVVLIVVVFLLWSLFQTTQPSGRDSQRTISRLTPQGSQRCGERGASA